MGCQWHFKYIYIENLRIFYCYNAKKWAYINNLTFA